MILMRICAILNVSYIGREMGYIHYVVDEYWHSYSGRLPLLNATRYRIKQGIMIELVVMIVMKGSLFGLQ